MQATQMKASNEQIRCIYGLAKKLGLNTEALHEKAFAVTREEHISRLTVTQASMLIDRMKGGKPSTPQPDTRPASRASQGQINLILGLATSLGWPTERENRARLNGFLRERYQVEHLDWLDPEQARKCTEALKAMLAGGRGERKGYHGTGNDDGR